MSKLTRVVIVDDKGRIYDRTNPDGILTSVQDDGRTLKVFVGSNAPVSELLQRAIERRD